MSPDYQIDQIPHIFPRSRRTKRQDRFFNYEDSWDGFRVKSIVA